MKRWLIRGVAVILIAVAAGFVAQRLFGDEAILGTVRVPAPVATIGSGEEAIGVAADGEVVSWWPLPAEPALPQLPLSEPPKGGRLQGPALQPVRVLAAAPDALRPYLAASYFGESGVDVETTAGIELRFGDSSQAARKWKAATAVLADPEISGHALPPSP